MPAGTSSNARAKFANIKKGKIEIYQGKDQPTQEVDFIEGAVTNIEFKEETFKGETKEKMILTIDDGKEAWQLKMNLDSSYGRTVCNTLPNAKLDEWIRFQPTYKDEKAGMFVSQDRTALKWKWTKTNPGDLPPLKVVRVKGKDTYDNYDQMQFLKNYILTEVCPKLGHAIVAGPATAFERTAAPGISTAFEDVIAPDDLPF